VGLRLSYERIPFISCAAKYAEQWLFPGGASDNASFFGSRVHFAPELDDASRMLLFDPQTSGGLLFAVAPDRVDALLARAEAEQQPLWVIGEVVEGDAISVEMT
jgi:selenide,water dikinase